MKPLVWVYRRHILHENETFIKNQVEKMTNFDYQYIGNTKGENIKNVLLLGFDGFDEATIEQIIREDNPRIWDNVLSQGFEKPSLIHAHFCEEGLIIYKLARFMRIPLIVTVHGHEVTLPDEIFVQEYVTKYRKNLFENCDLFIAVSNFIVKKMIEKGYPKQKLVQHYTGIDTAYFSSDKKVVREPIVLFVGRIEDIKGLEYLIYAMSNVQIALPEIELLVIGDGELRKGLEKLAKEKLKKFRFIGFQSQEIVKYYLNKATVFSAPSIEMDNGFTEALGTVFIEASAMGTPTVSFNNGGISEVIIHNQSGFLATNKNVDELAGYITDLFINKVKWNEFSEYGIARAQKYFDINKQNMILENIYNTVTNNILAR
jgi:colanic acid/amylovoran biosynthesis glycosyltransferase